MHRLNELATKLTPDQLKEVEDFAEFLISREANAAAPAAEPRRISFDGWAGCLAGIEPEKSDKEFVREAWDGVIDRIEQQGG